MHRIIGLSLAALALACPAVAQAGARLVLPKGTEATLSVVMGPYEYQSVNLAPADGDRANIKVCNTSDHAGEYIINPNPPDPNSIPPVEVRTLQAGQCETLGRVWGIALSGRKAGWSGTVRFFDLAR